MHDDLKSYLYKLYVEDLFANSFRKPNGTLDTLILLDELPKSKETLGSLWFSDKITVIPLLSVKTSESFMFNNEAVCGSGFFDRSI